jgi:hypothetical protein
VKKVYHQMNEDQTNFVPYGLMIFSFGPLILSVVTIISILIIDSPGFFFGAVLCLVIVNAIGYYSWFKYKNYRTYAFQNDAFKILDHKYNELASFLRNDVKSLDFQETMYGENNPHLELKFNDGESIVFHNFMFDFTSLVDDMEKWTGINIPNKEQRMKRRGNEALDDRFFN